MSSSSRGSASSSAAAFVSLWRARCFNPPLYCRLPPEIYQMPLVSRGAGADAGCLPWSIGAARHGAASVRCSAEARSERWGRPVRWDRPSAAAQRIPPGRRMTLWVHAVQGDRMSHVVNRGPLLAGAITTEPWTVSLGARVCWML